MTEKQQLERQLKNIINRLIEQKRIKNYPFTLKDFKLFTKEYLKKSIKFYGEQVG